MKRTRIKPLTFTLATSLVVGCPGADVENPAACPDTVGAAGVACDASVDPTCVSEASGVYVDGNAGSDSNDGRAQSPMRSIRVALSQAAAAGKARVYVCDAVYPENLVITNAVTLLGGLDCATWKYTGKHARIAPNLGGGAALEIRAANKFVSVLDIDVAGAPGVDFATDDTINSIGIFVPIAAQVTLQRMTITASTGGNGANAHPPMTNGRGDLESLRGNDANGATGGERKRCVCGVGASIGGAGATPDQAGESGGAELVDGGVVAGGDGGISFCWSGRPGPNGGPVSGDGASLLGLVNSTGWVPATGAPGQTADPGAGGGGGGAPAGTARGGGGACGGCGGAGGLGGAGGGASLALLIADAAVTVKSATLSASAAGNGGAGSLGETGGRGGSGSISGACGGGPGGNAAGGQGGQGGPGGVSVSILHASRPPTIEDSSVTMSAGTMGSGGAGGQGGRGGVGLESVVPAPNGPAGAAGAPGRAEKILQL